MIVQFYEGIANRFSDGRDQLILDEERIQRWIEEKPQSDTAQIALGSLLVDTAWVVRGSGWAKTVGEEQWQLFHQMLQGAFQCVGPLVNDEMTDPFAGTVLMTVALGQSWNPSQYEEMLSILEDRFPEFWGYPVQRAYSLLPRWHGEEGDWEAYALNIATSRNEWGEEVFARILFSLMRFYGNIFRETDAQCGPAKKGIDSLLSRYPESLQLLSRSARLATLGGDRDLAAELFEQLGDQYIDDCWANPEQFVHYRTWARTGKW